ncbi:MAG: sialidase family protein [Verrucomicrobiota bacterium]
MDPSIVLRFVALVVGSVLVGIGQAEEVAVPSVPFLEIRAVEIPVMAHVVVALDGSVLLFRENRAKGWVEAKRSEDGGALWSDWQPVGKRVKIDGDMSDDGRYRGDHVGFSELANALVDETTGDVMVFAGGLKGAGVAYRSRDHGRSWKTEAIEIKADRNGWVATTYCCDPGITLRHGRRKGRLVMPSQVFVGSVGADGQRTYLNKGQGRKYFARRYSNSLYSDDGGKTWTPSEPFPLLGSSEPSLVELADGSLFYLARTHCRPGNKWVGRSGDGGQTWQDAREDDELFDGPPDDYGCKGALLRLPQEDGDVLVFSSPGRRDKRNDITVTLSYDGGATWPVSRMVKEGPGNYTWLAAGRAGTPSEGLLFLVSNKDWMARFNLAWVMEKGDQESRPERRPTVD